MDAIPCCRWANSATFIPTIRCILFFGGFDSSSNHNDAALLSLDDYQWHELQFDVDIECRAFHSTASRMVTVKDRVSGEMKQQFEVYLFGGQWCVGGPYEYHNDVFKFTFFGSASDSQQDEDHGVDEDNEAAHPYIPPKPTVSDYRRAQKMKIKAAMQLFGGYRVTEVVVSGDLAPCPRSMSYSWIKGDDLYIFGGSRARSTLNDLWTLNLSTGKWTELKYQGVLGAPKRKKHIPRDMVISGRPLPAYFDAEWNEFVVLQYGPLTAIQREYIRWFDGDFEEFEEAVSSGKVAKKGISGERHCTVFTLNLKVNI